MNKLSYEVMDVSELENIKGGSELKYAGCIITNGKCSTEGGCGVCNGKCNGPIESEPSKPDPSQPSPVNPTPTPKPLPDIKA